MGTDFSGSALRDVTFPEVTLAAVNLNKANPGGASFKRASIFERRL
jgi:uncharacterized protein YjbI with pentapeptide repeats